MKRKLNLVFLAGLLGVVAAAIATTYFVHKIQVRRHLGIIFDQAKRFEADGNTEKAMDRLTLYLGLRPQDGDAWVRLARLRDQSTPEGRSHEQVYETYVRAMRLVPDDAALRRRMIDLAIELKRFSDARQLLQVLYKPAAGESPGGAEAAELEDLLGQCDEGESKVGDEDAGKWYKAAIKHDRSRVATSFRFAMMLRGDLVKDPGAADQVIAAMVKRNPRSARAYLNRWNYRQTYGPTADDKDIDRALELAPDDADVLLAAAQAAAGRNDRAQARRTLERGLKQHPKNASFYILSASIETQDNHLDQAEAVLRQGTEAVPDNLQLPFLLADLLISRNNLEGPGGAEGWIARLQARNLSEGPVTYLEARVLVAQRQWKEAVRKLNAARALLASDPTFPGRLSLMLAECLTKTGDESTGQAALRQAARSPEESIRTSAQQMLARTLEDAGVLDEALSEYALLAKTRPEAAIDVARLSIKSTRRLPRGRQQWSEAERRVKDAERAVPSATADLALLRADLNAAQGRYGDARKALEPALEKYPKDLRLWLSLAGIVESQKEWAEARKTLDRAEKELGASVDLSLARITGWSRQGGDEAKRALASLASKFPSSPTEDRIRLLDALGTAWLRLGDRQQARQALHELIKEQPGNRRALLRLCDLAIEVGDHAEARQVVSQLRTLESEDGTQWRYAEMSILIDLARRGDLKSLDQVPRLISEIALRRGDWWGVSVLKARVAEAQDRLEDAINHYLEAFKQGNVQPEIARHALGLLYRMQRFDQIDTLVTTLASRGVEPEDLKLATAMSALRKGDRDRAVAIARETVPEASTNPFDHITLGQVLQAAGKTQEAGQEFGRALELGPKVPAAWLAQVQFLVQTKQTDQARSAIESARKALPQDLAAATLAQCYALIGDASEAEKHLQLVLAVRPRDPEILRRAAEFYIDQKQNARAEPLLAKVLDPTTVASEEDQAWARRSLSLLKIQSGSMASIDEAIKRVEENLKTNPRSFDDQRARTMLMATQPARRGEAIRDLEAHDQRGALEPERRFLLALLYLANNERSKGEQQLLRLLNAGAGVRDPNHLMVMVRVQLDLGHLAEAERWLAELKQQGPMTPQILPLECSLLKAQNRESELRALLHAYERDHSDETGLLASLYDQFEFAREAEAAYRKAVVEKPGVPENVGRLIGFLGRQNRTLEALDLWKQARATQTPDLATDAAVALAVLPSVSERQRGEVESWLVETLKAQPRSRTLQLKLAYLRMKVGRSEEAESLYREILTDLPGEPQALNNLASLVAFHEGPRDEALSLVNQAIAVAGNVPVLLDTRALVHLQMNQPDQAIDDLRKALSATPNYPVAYFHLARANDQMGNSAEAHKSFEQAERMGLKPASMDFVERDEYSRLHRKLFKE
jgi:tetratricopeptide (TPR) repeat protein